jgi:hypothetical protein
MTTDSDTDAMLAEINRLGAQISVLVLRVRQQVEATHLTPNPHDGFDARYHIVAACPDRWVDIGSDHMQQGLMALRGAVQRPNHF